MHTLLRLIDSKLHALPMYRVVLYSLLALQFLAVVFGFLGILPYTGTTQMLHALVLYFACIGSNAALSRIFKTATNTESAYITALILFFLLWPLAAPIDLLVSAVAAILAMVSKYAFALHKTHLFNPAAISVVIIELFGAGTVIWWAGSLALLPAVVLLGFLVVRKVRREQMVVFFLGTAIAVTMARSLLLGEKSGDLLSTLLLSGPLVFFATIMLTEPLTAPPTERLRKWYAVLAGLLYSLPFSFGSLFSTPQLVLVLANFWSYVVSRRQKVTLEVVSKSVLAPETFDFAFKPSAPVHFEPGQYLEWLVPHEPTDSRGNRRFFTIASSPTEKYLHLGIKIPATSMSSFKRALMQLKVGQKITANQLGGDFTLPTKKSAKLAFIAGGIGVTPFRSMVAEMLDTQSTRDAVLFYAAGNEDSLVYRELFDRASDEVGLRCVYILTDTSSVPRDWQGRVGHITAEMIAESVPDFAERTFYISGPPTMVDGTRAVLKSLKVSARAIITDYFPGY